MRPARIVILCCALMLLLAFPPSATEAAGKWVDTPIRAYADKASINKGDSIGFHVGTIRPIYRIEIYRAGWYNGAGLSLITTISNLTGVNYPVPQPDSATGLLELQWPAAYTLQTDASWTSGVYLAKLIADNGSIAYILFVVRDDSAAADIVYQVPFTTYQAYNPWGGKSLYTFNSTNGVAAVKVSFNRPYSGDGTSNFWKGDYGMIRFLERNGYRVKYVTSLDTHERADLLDSGQLFLSNFHDEYWSRPMREHVTTWRDQGKDLAFFGANSIYWQIRFEPSTIDATPDRVIVCYKSTSDPVADRSLTTVKWRSAPVKQPENALLGAMYTKKIKGPYAWVVQNATHWFYAGTNLQEGESIPGLIGGEIDKVFNNGLTPPGTTILAQSPVGSTYQNATIYTAGSGALVFDAGTYNFAQKIDANDHVNVGVDPRVQTMTLNLLNQMLATP